MSYCNTSDGLEYAKVLNVTPHCAVAIVKYLYGVAPKEMERHMPPEPKPSDLPAEGHPYEALSDAELRDLAAGDADAAVVLARRLQYQYNDESLKWYERAVILGGQPEALAEWTWLSNNAGITYNNGILEVESVSLGYEMYLTLEKLGYDGPVSEFRQALRMKPASIWHRLKGAPRYALGR